MKRFSGRRNLADIVISNGLSTPVTTLKRTRRNLTISLISLLALMLATTAVVLAVHSASFELDSNAVDDPAGPPDDWQNIYEGNSSAAATTGIVHDGDNPPEDATYFTGGGSKDVNDINQWRYTNNDQAPDKDELTNVYAATYENDGEVTLYFGADRYASNGNSQIGFWFFQNPVSLGADGQFNGTHRVGDLLILSDFVKGGKIPEVKVYEWVGSGGSDGSLQLVMSGADCDDIPAGEDSNVCATVNDAQETAPWPYNPKGGKAGTFPTGSFYEGAVNLTTIGLSSDTCYASFLVETRSSSSVDATLKDFSLGALDICTTPQGQASLTIDPEKTAARIDDNLTFTVTATQLPDGVTAQPAVGVWVSASPQNSFGATAAGDTGCTTDGNGQCAITLSSPTTGKTTLNISADIPVNDTTLSRQASADMSWVNAQLSLTVSGDGVNAVGEPVTISAQLEFDYGDGQSWVNAPGGEGITIPITISSTGSTITEYCVTGPTGSCSVDYAAESPGVVEIYGEWQGVIDIVEGVQADASDQVGPVIIRWVGARLSLSPTLDANQVGTPHQLVAQLEYDDGLSVTPLPGQTVNFTINGPGAPTGDSFCQTDAAGNCPFSFVSAVTGTSVVSATWSGDILIEGQETPVPGSAGASAEKVWFNTRLTLSPASAAALTGQPQPVTAQIEVDSGSGFVAPISASGPVSVTLSSGPGTLSGSPCDFAGGQSCQVTLNSNDPGLAGISATWNGSVEVLPGVSAQASAGPASGSYRWVEAVLSLDPENAGGVTGQPHTLTATLQFDTGSGLQPASLEKTQDITFTLGGVGSLSAPTCIEAGTCTVIVESTEYGTSTITATWSGAIDTGEGNIDATLGDVATKSWFDLRVSIGEPLDDASCTDDLDPNDSVADLYAGGSLRTANMLAPGSSKFSRLCNEEDFDFYWLDIPESSFITITLSGMETDYDVAVYVALDDDLNTGDSSADGLTLVHVQNYADVDSVGRMSSGRMSSGRMSSGRMSSGRMSSGRMSSGRMSSGRMSSGRMSSGSDLSGAVNEQTVTFVEGPQRVFVAVFSGVGAYGPQYQLDVQTGSGDRGIGLCTAPNNLPAGSSASPYGSSSPKTLILTHVGRLEGLYGSAAVNELMSRLQTFAARPEINGLIVPVESNAAVEDAYAAWNSNYCGIGAANDVTEAIKANIIKAYPSAEYLVVAGSHEVIPFHQVPDYVSISPEGDYLASSLIVPNNPLYWTLANSWISTDDFYADAEPNLFRGRDLYVPDKPIGRLVESPADMIKIIDNYETNAGFSNITSCMVTGYEFLSDSAAAIDNQLRNFGLNPDTLNNDIWNRTNLNNVWSTGPDLASVNAHFEHYRLLPAITGNENQLYYSRDLPTNLGNSVNYSVGCHSGFNVPDNFVTNTDAKLDFPQAFAQRGAAAWVANTGYGYGDDEAIADSELLMLFLTQELGSNQIPGGIPTGDALVAAKQRFVSNFSADAFGLFEEKSLIEATLYGLPMHRVGVPTPQAVASLTNNLYPLAKLPGLASLDSTSTLVSRQTPERVTASLNSQTFNLNFTLTERTTERGRYFTPGGPEQVQVIPNQPLQPKESMELDQAARGALLISAGFNDLTDFDPVVSIPMSDTTILEPAFSVNGWFPDQPWEINRLGASPHLLLVPGQYNAINRTERLYDTMEIEVYTSDDGADFHPPGIWMVQSVCSADGPVTFRVKTDDAAGIARALVTYQQGNGWQSAELAITPHPDNDDSFLASGSIALPAGTPYFVQVLDNAGNVTVETNKGRYYQACIDRPDATNNLISDSTHPIPVRLEKNQGDGWQPVPGASFTGSFVTVDGGQIVNNTCTLFTDIEGKCEIRITSQTEGFTTVAITPIVTVTVDGDSYQLETGFGDGSDRRGRYVKEWWSGSIALFKQVSGGSANVCFTLSRASGGFSPQQQCLTVSGAYTFEWAGLPTGSDYVVTEDSVSGGYVTMQPNPLTDIEVNDANRSVVLRTEINGQGQGCTPGYWKNHLDRWSLTPQSKFKDVFGLSSFPKNPTLEQAINLGGGGLEKLARHGVAALLNARTNAVNSPYSQEQVIKMVQDGMNSKGEPQASDLATANELGCPLN